MSNFENIIDSLEDNFSSEEDPFMNEDLTQPDILLEENLGTFQEPAYEDALDRVLEWFDY